MTSDPGRRRRQVISLILSGLFPGLGQLYNRRYVKGGAFLIAGAILTWLMGRVAPADLWALAQLNPSLMLWALALLGVWLWSVIDAWRVAGR